jgi:hypothetical protein
MAQDPPFKPSIPPFNSKRVGDLDKQHREYQKLSQDRFKSKQVRDTLCRHRGAPLKVGNSFFAKQVSQLSRLDAPPL